MRVVMASGGCKPTDASFRRKQSFREGVPKLELGNE
jgi:hypothetical protein